MGVAVFIVNQNLQIEELRNLINKKRMDTVIVSSHHLFPGEETFLKKDFNYEIQFFSVDEFYFQHELSEIDDKIMDELTPIWCSTGISQYSECMSKRLFYKTELLAKKIKERFNPDYCFVVNGLGIDFRAVLKYITAEEIIVPNCETSVNRGILRLSQKIRFTYSIKLSKVKIKDQDYFFIGNYERVRSRIRTWKYSPSSKLPLFKIQWILKKKLNMLYGKYIIPMHQYITLRRNGVNILQDGHLPSKYTLTPILSFTPNDVMIVSNPFAKKWLSGAAIKSCLLPGYSDPLMLHPKPAKTMKKVLFALNHAGDWSSMINRSDTDRLIIFAAKAAADNPDLEILIRPHPTMTHPLHEGCSSYKRIEKWIKVWGLVNLFTSRKTLEEDLEWADLVVSEYSQVLIEAWTRGIPGVVVNPTNRECFMHDYTNIGFFGSTRENNISRYNCK